MSHEGPDLEYKESVTANFLKTVSAYANYGTGRIIFGVTDDGETVGLMDPRASALDIENAINDAIKPRPDFHLAVDEGPSVVTLTVLEGQDTPYLYKGQAYGRADSASVPVDRVALGRLVLKGQNRSYDELPCGREALSFGVLAQALSEELNVSPTDLNVLRTLGLYTDRDGYTNAADILADSNDRLLVDVARFRRSEDEIAERHVIKGVSLLAALTEVMTVFDRTYTYEKVEDTTRNRIETIPRAAFKEALANALVHRTWDVDRPVQVGMLDDRIRIVSPGGLPEGLSREEYLYENVSVLRNPIIAGVLFRLGIIEQFGTGVRRILRAYQDAEATPRFHVYENSLCVVLPTTSSLGELEPDERLILGLLMPGISCSRKELQQASGFERNKVIRAIAKLRKKELVRQVGAGPSTRYLRA